LHKATEESKLVEISGSIKGAVAIVVITVVLLAMTPTVVDQVQSLPTNDLAITGEFLGDADNATTLYYFDETPCKNGSETIYQNTTEVTNYNNYYSNAYIIGINFTTALLDIHGNITADYTREGWHFTGYQGAVALIGLVPFLWVAGILAGASVGMFTLYKGGKTRMVVLEVKPKLSQHLRRILQKLNRLHALTRSI